MGLRGAAASRGAHDTLDSIALEQLGARGRAEDLGLTPAQLAARRGRYINLPGA